MHNTTHNSTYIVSPRQPAYMLGDGDSSIPMAAWLRLPQSFFSPTKLLRINTRSRAFPLPRRAAVAAGSRARLWAICRLGFRCLEARTLVFLSSKGKMAAADELEFPATQRVFPPGELRQDGAS